MLHQLPLKPANILIPAKEPEYFSTIACDQFTSEPAYWENVSQITEGKASAFHITLPEIYLESNNDKRILDINKKMNEYLENKVFIEYKDSMVYVERTLSNGKIRRGIIGAIDLEAYDYSPNARTAVRATEETVPERIPPRVKIRRDAPLELPHVMLLIDDPEKTVIEPLTGHCLKTIYDFDLMTGAGHLKGKLISKSTQEQVLNSISRLGDSKNPMLFAVGDGNHSLATAAECYRQNPTKLNRYALVEIVNIHDATLCFEPIYRVLFNADARNVALCAKRHFDRYVRSGSCTSKLDIISKNLNTEICCPSFPVEELQNFINSYIKSQPQVTVDYIHGEESLRSICQKENTVGFLFSGMKKNELFPYIKEHGILPRKSFSMGEALDKRFYMECRKIK